MSTIKVDTIQTRTGTGNITASNTIVQTEYMIDQWRLSQNTNNSTNGVIASNWERVDTPALLWSGIGTQMQQTSGLFTFPRTGLYQVTFSATVDIGADQTGIQFYITSTPDNGSNFANHTRTNIGSPTNSGGQAWQTNVFMQTLINVTNISNYKVQFENAGFGSGTYIYGNSDLTYSGVMFERKGPAQ